MIDRNQKTGKKLCLTRFLVNDHRFMFDSYVFSIYFNSQMLAYKRIFKLCKTYLEQFPFRFRAK